MLEWSGTPYFMGQALEQQNIQVERNPTLKRTLPPFFKIKQWISHQCFNQRESPRFNLHSAQSYSKQFQQWLSKTDADVILAPQINPICYLETDRPIILWTDALYESLLSTYPSFQRHSPATIKQGHSLTKACLQRLRLAVFSSEWAAKTAIEKYQVDPKSVFVVPFGANLPSVPTYTEIKSIIDQRDRNKLKLLFIGKSWERKGGDVVMEVANKLYNDNKKIELHLIGCTPPAAWKNAKFVHYHGFINKHHPHSFKTMKRLLTESHFLFVPSRAEAFGIVFCEANAFGLPCLTSTTGGIPSIIKNNINGMTFPNNASVEDYCVFIERVFNSPSLYSALAYSSYNEYQTRLNWQTAAESINSLIKNKF